MEDLREYSYEQGLLLFDFAIVRKSLRSDESDEKKTALTVTKITYKLHSVLNDSIRC